MKCGNRGSRMDHHERSAREAFPRVARPQATRIACGLAARRVFRTLAAAAAIVVAPALRAQEPAPESLVRWAYEQKLRPVAAAKYVDFTAPPALFDKARPDLADLRLRDASDHELPYALRIRRDESRVVERPVQEFNHSRL